MQKWISFVLSLTLVFCLAGCGATDVPEEFYVEPSVETQEPDVLPVTAEELLTSNYGVEDLQSVTLGLLIQVSSDKLSGKFGGTFEQTKNMFHLMLDVISPSDDDSMRAYSIYYDLVDQTLYSIDSTGMWVKSNVPDYSLGLNELGSLSAIDLIEDAVLSDARDGYRVSGVSTSGVVSDLMGFMFDGADFGGVPITICFTYDKDSLMLKNMHWDAEQDGIKLSIDADVSGVNATSILVPFDKELVPLGNDESEEPNDQEYVPGRLDGELLMCELLYSTDYVREPEFIASLPSQYQNLHEGVLYMTRYYMNSYSVEGFQRMLASSKPDIEEELTAVVLVCELAGIPYECLWQSGFMVEGEVNNIVAVLTGN